MNKKESENINKDERDPVEIVKSWVGIVSEDDSPPKGEAPRLDHILGRDRDDGYCK